MATIFVISCRLRHVLAATLAAAAICGSVPLVHGQDPAEVSSDQAVSKTLIDEATAQIETFCKARNMLTLQVVDFRGTVGARESTEVKREWLDSLKERGISMRDVDSTRISGCIETQASGDTSIIVLKCTLSDSRGGEIRTFRVRRVIAAKTLI